MNPPPRQSTNIARLGRDALLEFVEEGIQRFGEPEALAVLSNPFCSAQIIQILLQNDFLLSFYSVISALVRHRATPQAHALKFAHFLYWSELLRYSVDVRISSSVRKVMDDRLIARIPKLSIGEKMSTARGCSREVAKVLMFDPDRKVFAALLNNARLREEDLLFLINSKRASAEKLTMISDHEKWSTRYSIRRDLARNVTTPKSVAASQLRHLRRIDLEALARNPSCSVYLRRCIENLQVQATKKKR